MKEGSGERRTEGQNKPGFAFDLTRAHGMLRITFTGQWLLDTVERYRVARAEEVRAARAAGISSKDLVMLVDRRSQPVQTQDVVAALGQVVSDNPQLSRRTAILVLSALHARQITRTAPSKSLKIFENEADALQWLSSQD